MALEYSPTETLRGSTAILACTTLVMNLFAPAVRAAQPSDSNTATPIKHLIVIVGENRSFDHIFATYQSPSGDTVKNLLSEKIVNADGTPGVNYVQAQQYSATNTSSYEISPTKTDVFSPYLPAPLNGGPANACTTNGMCNYGDARSSEDGLSSSPIDYYNFLLTGGTGLTGSVPDTRITGVHNSAPYSTLTPGPFQLTNSTTTDSFPYDSYAFSPVHRFFQMWQQTDCAVSHATATNPSGCLNDLFVWTAVTAGSNENGKTQPANFSTDYAPGKVTTGEGGSSMGFYNMQQGDAPYTKYLADHYAISDNYHQPAMGGTGLDSVMLFFGDAIWFSDENGVPETPPNGTMTAFGGPVYEIENPNPQTGTNNWWIQDGYGGFGNAVESTGTSTVSATGVYGGGSYVNCSDKTQPGVQPILTYLQGLGIDPKCESSHYYLVNNYNPGYFGDGSDAYTDTNPTNTPFTVPGSTQRSIADVLLANNISWKSYNDQWDRYLTDKYQLNYGTVGPQSDQYCNICNGFQYQKQIMTNDAIRTSHIMDVDQLYQDINNGKLPAVSFVKPSGWVDGHPASSKWDLYEGFAAKIVDAVQSKPDLWAITAIFITTDEGGGYYDSGYIQPLDFFGDGTRIPLIVVSPYTKAGHVSHSYADHVSILKFIEHNWHLPAISNRSRDNLPNPTTSPASGVYVPTNSPAISDLFDLFQFN